MKRRVFVGISVALATIATASVLARPASAHFDTVTSHLFWAFSGCPAQSAYRRAPVNVVFYHNATSSTSLSFLVGPLSWTSTDGTSWRYQSHSDCGWRDWQRASAPTSIAVGATRYFTEMRHTFDADVKWGLTTIGTVRREIKKTATCLAAISPNGYDQGRWYLQSHLPSFGFRSTYWGNTQTFAQCDGTTVGSNGYTYWFRVP